MYWKENLLFWKNLVNQPQFGLITDFDGTLSPIVKNPDAAQIKPGFLPLLSILHQQISLVGVVSGRRADDVQKRVGISGIMYIGNHGFERCLDGQLILPDVAKPFTKAISEAKQKIIPMLLPGMTLEDKFITLTVHFRNAEQQEIVENKFLPFLEALTNRMDLELHRGRKVFELRPPLTIDKGTAFQHLIKDFKVQSAVYLGDDTTDAAAFRAAKAFRNEGVCNSFGIGVHSENTPTAVLNDEDYYVDGVDDVMDFLTFLVNSLKASST